MGLFQNVVLNKYLKTLDKQVVGKAYSKFKDHFHNPVIQQNIKDSKEEQYQGEFLIDLFVNVLGYIKNPTPNFNITTEYKNVKDSKKADGAIIIKDKVKVVIELKGTETTDLSKVESQAFGYKNNQPDCIYIIISNYEKLRFYIDNATEHYEFNLFTLTEDEFNLLYLCLCYDNIDKDIPKKIKDESIGQEEIITKKLYSDYTKFKRELHTNLIVKNPKIDQIELFKKSQKLLDRFLFLFFAEDRQLLPPNSVRLILSDWKELKERDEEIPLYNRFKKYFEYLNTGYKGKRYDVFAYNGGLFKPDEILDSVVISDDLLYNNTLKLSEYDFASDVDVNILGHIFENSLNELDEIKAEIEGIEFDKTKNKRKKDGVFYTPKYITKYIVDNTIGKLCDQKRIEFKINETDYKTDKNRQKKATQLLSEKLTQYRSWLLKLTICDPACGSGAFLNQALDFLINEHKFIDELQAKLFGDSLILSDVENSILENNLFGVDLNEESIEIAKLSLWLRTAQPNRKLNDLNNNIKCGNSLIDNPKYAGDKAFNWEKMFPNIFANKGFDIIIGNPPYVRVQGLKENYFEQTKYYETKYESATGKYDIYVLFIEKAFKLINEHGVVSFILPHKFLVSDFGSGIRAFILKNKNISSLVHFGSEIVFQDASTYTCIVNLSHNNKGIKFKELNPLEIMNPIEFEVIKYETLDSNTWNFKSGKQLDVLNSIYKVKTPLIDYVEGIYQGIISMGDDIFMIRGAIQKGMLTGYSEALQKEITIEEGSVKKVLKGQDIKRYLPLNSDLFVIFPHFIDEKNNTKPYEEKDFENLYPLAYNYLLEFKSDLVKKKIKYKTNPKYWYSLHRSREMEIYRSDYIVTPQLQNKPSFTINTQEIYSDAGGYTLIPKKGINRMALLGILNSKLLWFFIKNTSSEYSGGYFYFKTKYLENFPIPSLDNLPNDFTMVVQQQLIHSQKKEELAAKTTNYLKSVFKVEINTKLRDWYDLEFSDFLNELNKSFKRNKIQSLSKKDEFELLDLFEKNKKEINEIESLIYNTDKAIDQMVYELYNISSSNIKVIEAS